MAQTTISPFGAYYLQLAQYWLAIAGLFAIGCYGYDHERPALMRRIAAPDSPYGDLATEHLGGMKAEPEMARESRGALLFVDGQETLRQPLQQDAVDRIRLLSKLFNAEGLPVFRQIWQPRSTRSEDALTEDGTPLVLTELDGASEEWVSRHYDAFVGFPFEERLRSYGVKTLFIVGTPVESCVVATAYHAHAAGFHVVLVGDAIVSQGDTAPMHHASLHSLAFAGVARVISTAQARSLLTTQLVEESHGVLNEMLANSSMRAIATDMMQGVPKDDWRFFERPRSLALVVMEGAGYDWSKWQDDETGGAWAQILLLEQLFHIWNRPIIHVKSSEFPWNAHAATTGALMDLIRGENAADTLVLAGGPLWTGELLASAFAAVDNHVDVIIASDAVSLSKNASMYSAALAARANLLVLTNSIAHSMTVNDLLHPVSVAVRSCMSHHSGWISRHTDLIAPWPGTGCDELHSLAYSTTQQYFGGSAADAWEALGLLFERWPYSIICFLLAAAFVSLLFVREAMWRAAGRPDVAHPRTKTGKNLGGISK